MLDINYVREHLDEVRERLATRGFDTSTLDRFSELDVRREVREIEAEEERAEAVLETILVELKHLNSRLDRLESRSADVRIP